MLRIALLSDDPVFSKLLCRNLEKRGHEVTEHFVRTIGSAQPETLNLPAVDDLILDLHWYDEGSLETFLKLAEFTTRFQVPMILLVDSTWPMTWLRRFPAKATIDKPFRIDRLIRALER